MTENEICCLEKKEKLLVEITQNADYNGVMEAVVSVGKEEKVVWG